MVGCMVQMQRAFSSFGCHPVVLHLKWTTVRAVQEQYPEQWSPWKARSKVCRAQSPDLPNYISTSLLNRRRPEVSAGFCKANILNLSQMWWCLVVFVPCLGKPSSPLMLGGHWEEEEG